VVEEEEATKEALEEEEKGGQGEVIRAEEEIRVGRKIHSSRPSINPAKTASKMMRPNRITGQKTCLADRE